MKYTIKSSLKCFSMALLFFTIVTKISAQPRSIKTVFDSLKAINEIDLQNKKYLNALNNSDSVGVSNIYTLDARMLNNGGPSTIGRTAILHFYGGMIRRGVTGFSYVTTGVWGGSNDIVAEEGTLTFSIASGKMVAKGRYLLLWKREDGKLKIFRDTFAEDDK